jgi:hypothetical protein
MKIPEAIKSISNHGIAGEHLVRTLSVVDETSEVAEVVRLLAEALVEAQSRKAAVQNPREPAAPEVDFSKAASMIEDQFFLHPRGKQRVGFFCDRLVIRTAKQDITVLASDVEDVVILDSIPKDTKNRVYILLNFKQDAKIMNGKTKMRASVIQVGGEQQLDIQHPKDPSKRLSGLAAVVICQAIGTCGISGSAAFHSSSADVFRSCTNTAAVEAFVKARQGFLFPLLHGLCFMESPAIFIHKDKIRSVDFCRAGGASSTFDFQVHLKSGAIEEFSNISRHELGSVQNWVDKTKIPIGFPETDDAESSEDGRQPDAPDSSDDEDKDDEDFDPFKKPSKKPKVANEDCSISEESSSDDEDEDVELVDEDDVKVSALQKQLDREKSVAELDNVKMKRKDGEEDDEDDVEDVDYIGNDDSQSHDDSDSEGVELVDEDDLKVGTLMKHLEQAD